jgi:peptidoglycan hydrolase-like protein with peptidoglycan-binding domain
VLVLALLGFGAAVVLWSGVTLGGDASTLARLEVEPFGGSLESARAFGPGGRPIPLTASHGAITPRVPLTPGEQVTVAVVVRRPGWLGWLIGTRRTERLTVRAPAAQVRERWLTVPSGAPVRIVFDRPVSSVAYTVAGKSAAQHFASPRRSISLGRRAQVGSLVIAAAPQPWERLGTAAHVSWFPTARQPVVLAKPAPGSRITPVTPIRLTFSQPLSDVLGSGRPRLSAGTNGQWRTLDSHTLVYTPSGFGAPLASRVSVGLPRSVDVVSGAGLRSLRQIEWTVPAGSTLRLQQLLADAGYLPLTWTPAGAPVGRTPQAEELAAINAPAGHFDWRYPNTPSELKSLWSEGQANEITRGAVMMFEDEHGLAVDGDAGAHVWAALLADAIAGKQRTDGYNYVFVHRTVPQSLNLWHDGSVILTSPGNTGVPAAPTQLGTFPVFEHIPVGTMSGTNPDGTHYHDPGIQYISYFNGGDAIHSFNRASYGTPQSLGCVELPLAAAARVWPYTPIGTLVTIEN